MRSKSFSRSRRPAASRSSPTACKPAIELLEVRRMLSVNVLTFRYDGALDGLNSQETALTPSNVNSAQFGELFSIPVDGQVYAQPLYLSSLAIPGDGTHNVLFVATENDSVYAFDANSGSLLWHDSLIDPSAGVTPVPNTDLPDPYVIAPEVGITSAPVIDSATDTLYVVAYTKDVSGSSTSYEYSLYALDAATGAEEDGGPVTISGSVNGTGEGNNGQGQVVFNALQQDQRPGLLLLNGVVYVAFASWGDSQPYHGWIMGYNAATLQQVAVFNDTPNGGEGGIWLSNGGMDTDGTYIYLSTGNGTFDTTLNSSGFPIDGDYGDSVIKLAVDPDSSPTNQNINGWGLQVVDYFTPDNQQTLDDDDLDLDSGGVLLLPTQAGPYPDELIAAGKQGTIYVINRNDMGHFDPNANNIIQELDGVLGMEGASGGAFDTPAYFNGEVYYGGVDDPLEAFQVNDGLLSTSPTSESGNTYQYPGASPTVSADGTSDGIVWALQTSNELDSPAVLYAYNATNLSDELYNSIQVASRDQAGPAVRFEAPVVANGEVFVATDGQIDVYGLLPTFADAGFEQPSVGAGQFQYQPTGSPWTFTAGAGISANDSGFTAGNPPAPQGTQVAFLQGTGSFSQSVTGWPAGSYAITFEAAQRGNHQTSHQEIQVLVDNALVGTYVPSGTSYQSITTNPFPITAGTHTITFQGLNLGGGDNTAFVDAVTVAMVGVPTPGDAGFEQPAVGSGQFQYQPTGSPWTFTTGAGIAANGSGFTADNPSAPQGTQVAFLQDAGSFSQLVTGWATGSYTINFLAAQRANVQASQQNFEVLVDGVVVGTFTPSGTQYQSESTSVFRVTDGAHTITFQGLDSAGGDNTAFVDAVSVVATGLWDPDFAQVSVGAGRYAYGPVGSPWIFSSGAGISANDSGFTAGNPPAPEGTQVAFLQGKGSTISQTVNLAAGSYAITFSAAQRENYQASRQNFEVLVNGVVINTFTPSTTSYQTFSTAVFTVSAGANTIVFQGLDTAGGDNTAFLDSVSLAAIAPAVSDGGFEQVSVGAGKFAYDPAGTPWTFTGGAGISGNDSGFTAGNPPAPEGVQVAFAQGAGSFSQTVTGWAAGSYTLTFLAAQRANVQTSQQNFNVLVDGVVVGTFTPSSTSYQSYSTAVFTVTSGSHTIAFQGLDSAGGDNTVFIDDVGIS
jgi:hypothetical protein